MDHLSHFNMIMNIIALINKISNLLKKESLMPNWEVGLEIMGIYVQKFNSFFLSFFPFLSLLIFKFLTLNFSDLNAHIL